VIDIRRCTIDQIVSAPNYRAVIAEYAAESSIPEMGEINPQLDTYRSFEKVGMLFPIGAFDGELLAGMILPMATTVPHYGVMTAVAESFFVRADCRCTGLGLRLLAAAEELAKSLNCKAFLLSAPAGGALSQVMHKKKGYRHSNEAFVKAL
tara:strand:- start:4459 stop:4911 length:453 start_codon:yes stop_codon:yes gene_type:complete